MDAIRCLSGKKQGVSASVRVVDDDGAKVDGETSERSWKPGLRMCLIGEKDLTVTSGIEAGGDGRLVSVEGTVCTYSQ